MKRILATLVSGLMIAAFAAYAELPAPPPKSDAEKASEAQKAAATKAQDAADLSRAQDKAVANYRKTKGASAAGNAATPSSGATAAPRASKPGAADAPGADHAKPNPPQKDLTQKEAQTEMPTPGQANDHSSTGRETVPSGR